MLPKGTRMDDPRDLRGLAALKFRLGLAVKKYPIQVALLVTLGIACYPILLLITASNRIEAAQEDLQDVVVTTTISRQASSKGYCEGINDNTKALNALTDYFIGLVEKQIKDDKLKDDEVTASREFVTGLQEKKVLPLDCKVFQGRIERDIQKLRDTG